MMMTTRRNFMLGMTAVAGLPLWAKGGEPSLRLGVLSDVHFRKKGKEDKVWTAPVRAAFGLFRKKGVDGVVICGDLADAGLVFEMEELAKCWFDVFPSDIGADGKKVRRLFIYGNHDHEGWKYFNGAKKDADGKLVPADGCLVKDYAGSWERIWGEPWKQVRMEEVNGYKVVLQHFNGWGGGNPAVKFLQEHRAELAGDRPFIYVQHVHPKNTCADSEREGDAKIRAALNAFPNAIALSGHSHRPNWQDGCFWHGEFVSLGCGCAKFTITADGRENSFPRRRKGSLTPGLNTHDGTCAEYLTLGGGELRVERWDVSSVEQVGAPWCAALPLRPVAGPEDNPARWPSRAALAAPQFAAGVKGKAELSEKDGRRLVAVSFPPAESGRAHDYRVSVVAGGKGVLDRRVFAPHYYRAPSVSRGMCKCVFPLDELPSGNFTFEVRPVAENGREGRPVLVKFAGA